MNLQTTRIRIHRQLPGKEIPIHTDDNNGNQRTSEYNLRVTALTESDDFIYQFDHEEKVEQV